MSADLTQDRDDVPEEEVPVKERAATLVFIAYGQHGRVVDDQRDDEAVASEVFELAKQAVVTKRADRVRTYITRRAFMARVWPKVAGPEEWETHEDPEAAEAAYKMLDGAIWRLLTMDSTGVIQSRFNGESGLVLCRFTAGTNSENRASGVYVTRDLARLLADYSGPQREAIKRLSDRLAMNLAMAMDRVPEHATRLNRELTGGLKDALRSGEAITAPALEEAKQHLDGSSNGDEPNAEDE